MNKQYAELVEKVRAIDPDAAAYMVWLTRWLITPEELDFFQSADLITAFLWACTPQGHYYWNNINERLRRDEENRKIPT